MDEYFWTAEDFAAVKKSSTLPELLAVAKSILYRMPSPVSLVSGPISTGGLGDRSENIKAFAEIIHAVRKTGVTVFNQLPFEEKFSELAFASVLPYFQPILDEFFLPLFKSGKITEVIFMNNWDTSTGAKWEHEMAKNSV